jgi:hypothetical protein
MPVCWRWRMPIDEFVDFTLPTSIKIALVQRFITLNSVQGRFFYVQILESCFALRVSGGRTGGLQHRS